MDQISTASWRTCGYPEGHRKDRKDGKKNKDKKKNKLPTNHDQGQ